MSWRPSTAGLYALGLFAFALAGLSIVDMYLPRPYDGVVLESDSTDLRVRAVVPGSGADRAGIRQGDLVVGIGRNLVDTTEQAAAALNRHSIGETVPYLLRRGGSQVAVEETAVTLGRRQIGDTTYLFACLLGFSFFLIGLFVLREQPELPASQVLFLLCTLFLLFLVCRLRPASYSLADTVVLRTGTAALALLPASFLHFFLIFPRPVWEGGWSPLAERLGRRPWRGRLLIALYLFPVLVLGLALYAARGDDGEHVLISGAPAANWWLLTAFVALGLAILAANSRRLAAERERRGARAVLIASLAGLLPFLVVAVGFPERLEQGRWFLLAILPLSLIPLTFAYAIIRYRLLNVRVILRKSLLYTVTTALVTALYALGIASVNGLFRGSAIADSAYFPLVFALTIVVLFEPLRRQVQVPVDRFFFAERSRLQRAMVEMGEAFTAQTDPAAVVEDLVKKLPQLLGLRFAALYQFRGEALERLAGPRKLPRRLVLPAALYRHLSARTGLALLDDLDFLRHRAPDVDATARQLAASGVEAVGALATSRRRIGLVLLSGKSGQTMLEADELDLLKGLLHQASIALETSLLLDERARQAELERELQIAAAIQRSLLPDRVELAPGWRVAAVCRPARHVGGDFFAVVAGPRPGVKALIYGDVAGKSVPGALMMMAAKEVLHSLALSTPGADRLFDLANQRLLELGQRGFVAVGYMTPLPSGDGLSYLLAGQPPPLKRRLDGSVEALALGAHRLPLGALPEGGYRALETPVGSGELVLMYSDGVPEAQSPEGEMFGEERLIEVLQQAPADPAAVVREVLAALDAFTRGRDPYDDVTLLALQRTDEVTR